MKKRLTIISIVFLVILITGLGMNYLLSLHKVTFDLDNETSSITVFTSDDKEVKKLSSDSYILTKSGKYYVIPEGDSIAKDKIEFTVEDSDKTVTIRPPYTEESLKKKLSSELNAIKTAVAAKYPALIDDYVVSQGSLYQRGEWYGGLLKPKVSDIRELKDPYRIILHKKDGTWEVVRRPEYILTSSRYNEVPVEILRDVNQIVGEPGN